MNTSQIFVLLGLLFITSLCIGCTSINLQGNSTNQTSESGISQATPDANGSSWVTIPVTDVVTGKQNTIVDLAAEGKPLIIHTFAVWCPACSMQLRETKKLLQENPDGYKLLAIDIDPREDLALVKKHIEKNQFLGMFAVSPSEMTESLIDTLGTQIIQSLPQTIVVYNKSVVYIGDGVFPAEKLKVIIPEIINQFDNK